jgi:hypothetical protein
LQRRRDVPTGLSSDAPARNALLVINPSERLSSDALARIALVVINPSERLSSDALAR